MKFFFLLLCLSMNSAYALPYTCESLEKNDIRPVMRFKINKEVLVEQDGKSWKLNLVGVTAENGFRKKIYAQGRISESEIMMTFIKDSFVLGSVSAYNRGEEDVYEGEARISQVNKGKVTQVRCVKNK